MVINSVSALDDPAMAVLAEPRQAAPAHAPGQCHEAGQASSLGVRIAAQNWLVDMADIGGVLPLPPLTPVPLAKPWLIGVVNVRGMLYGVTDMAAYRQQGKTSGTAANRILLVAERHVFNAALLVDGVLGLRNARAWEQHRVGEQMQCRDELGGLWLRLDVAELLGQPDFLQAGI